MYIYINAKCTQYAYVHNMNFMLTSEGHISIINKYIYYHFFYYYLNMCILYIAHRNIF